MATKYVSVVQSGVNNYLTSAELLNNVPTNTILPGIVGSYTNTSGVAPATGNFAVNAQGSPNMTVAVSSGKAYVSATPTSGNAQTVEVRSDATENVTISANSTGSTRYDFVYIKVDPDKMNNPSVAGTDVATFITSRSTTQNVDSNGTPSNTLLLAIVTVINGASSIANSDIYDARIQCSRASDGWVSANESWAYASATTITVPTGATGKYSVGDKVRIYQANTIKYFYITGVAATTLTVYAGSDYTVANSTILNPCYSKAATPVGFPQSFAFTPSWTNLTVGSATNSGTVSMSGKRVYFRTKLVLAADSSIGTAPYITPPITMNSGYSTNIAPIGLATYYDSGNSYKGTVVTSSTGRLTLMAEVTTGSFASFNNVTAAIPVALSTSDEISTNGWYDAA